MTLPEQGVLSEDWSQGAENRNPANSAFIWHAGNWHRGVAEAINDLIGLMRNPFPLPEIYRLPVRIEGCIQIFECHG